MADKPYSVRPNSPIPGPVSTSMLDDLARYECPGITARRARREEESGCSSDPIVWKRGNGSRIEDVDGNVFVDFTAAFAVSAFGHANPELADAVSRQASMLMHGMGDVFPTDVKIRFAKRLGELVPDPLRQSILGQSGAEAVEAALKTAFLASGRGRILAFHGSYHGMSLGALSATAYKNDFRSAFGEQINHRVTHVPYPYCFRCPMGTSYPQCGLACLEYISYLLRGPATGAEQVGCVIVEPVQGRGGCIVPPPEWLQGLESLCGEHDLVLIFDEIFTGFGRTGRRFALEHSGVVPDVLCLGKAMSGGFPISAAVGTNDVMSAWGLSPGEAIHTSTFLGNPMGCAVALKAVEILERDDLPRRVAQLGEALQSGLNALQQELPAIVGDVRGLGLMQGIEIIDEGGAPNTALCLRLVRGMLERGFLLLPSGTHGQVLSFDPPYIITELEIEEMLAALRDTCHEASHV